MYKRSFILTIAFLFLSVFYGYSQDPPDKHPARQMRMYYADIYTGANILEYKAQTLDSILFVVSKFIEPAQVISVYSYKYDPYNFRRESIFKRDVKQIKNNPPEKLVKTTYGYSGCSGFVFCRSEGAPVLAPFTCYNSWRPRQNNSY